MNPLVVALLLAQPPAKLFPPDAATTAKIAALRADLDGLLAKLPADAKHRADVAIYAKAAEWAVRHNEWYAANSAAQTVRALEAGIARAKELAAGRTPWRDVTGKPVALGFVSAVDGSVQPVLVTRPANGPANPDWVCDVVLHGRDNTLTEVKFLARAEGAKAGNPKRLIVEPFGRGNTAYRWAGETDVFEAVAAAGSPDPKRTVLRGFSMGGAGTWHLGLHHPLAWAAIQPGAGFTTTRGYVKLPDDLPPHVEKCLTIYDADRYAANVVNVPTVAYSGADDKQKAAADGIERALKGFPEKVRFTHIVAPGLEHKQPPEWVAKCDAELATHLPRKDAERVRLVTHHPRFGDAGEARILALIKQYEPAVADVRRAADGLKVTTENVRVLSIQKPAEVDGQMLPGPERVGEGEGIAYVREAGRWARWQPEGKRWKCLGQTGPIDYAFLNSFAVVPPTRHGWHPATAKLAADTLDRFAGDWDRYLRGHLPDGLVVSQPYNRVLFGDPASNLRIAEILPRLPIKWTRDELVVNGVRYDAATHLPVLIYPDPIGFGCVVLNSGHTFGEKEFQGSNALLYPRLGDWAVRKVTGQVVASGLFDEDWQFTK